MRRGILVLAFCGFGCSDGSGKQPPPGPQPAGLSTDTIAAFDAAVDPLRQKFDVPGVAVALVSRGETVFAQGYGLRDLESGESVTPDTVFRIGSITKSFSSALIATLVDDGALTFETRV